MSTEIVEYDNFWSHIVFIGEAKFHIFGHVIHYCQLEQ